MSTSTACPGLNLPQEQQSQMVSPAICAKVILGKKCHQTYILLLSQDCTGDLGTQTISIIMLQYLQASKYQMSGNGKKFPQPRASVMAKMKFLSLLESGPIGIAIQKYRVSFFISTYYFPKDTNSGKEFPNHLFCQVIIVLEQMFLILAVST